MNETQVSFIKELKKLLILDFSGNPVVSSAPDYRLYMVFNLRRIKVAFPL